ncbi:hypothetical protein LR48_Vigan02g144800 [Vigna angularis]|uniref:Uncharacterized protein n=1 Tax=Phaseolus angularis TaxID=3914 RepID=A0A0L9TXI4_PHAAN|nr:hypothetical protein LR48_Vigan02g144800 [Vigna angularis]
METNKKAFRYLVDGEEDGGATHSENVVVEEHGVIVTEVLIEGYVLYIEHQGVGVRVDFEKVLSQVNRNEFCTASHVAQVVALDVVPQLVVVNNELCTASHATHADEIFRSFSDML